MGDAKKLIGHTFTQCNVEFKPKKYVGQVYTQDLDTSLAYVIIPVRLFIGQSEAHGELNSLHPVKHVPLNK